MRDKGKQEVSKLDKGITKGCQDIEIIEPEVEILEILPGTLQEGNVPHNIIDEEKIFAALTETMESGGKVTEVARKMGVSLDTLGKWLHKYKEEARTFNEVERYHVSTLMLHRTKELANGITKDKIDRAPLKDIAIAMGIAADKWSQLTGPNTGPTGINLKVAWKDGSGAVELTTGSESK